jgi:hypothetical protein
MCKKPRIGLAKKFLKIFSKNPKVLKRAAVTGLDVAKKSRFHALFFRSKQRFFGTSTSPETRAARAWMSDLRVFVRQTPTGRVRYFPTKNTESYLFSVFCCSSRMYLNGNANVFRQRENCKEWENDRKRYDG